MTVHKNTYCSFCGTKYTSELWPRFCLHCKETTWQNPLPATVIVCPVFSSIPNKHPGLLLIRRSIEPHIGELAFPGGYLDVGETWQQGASRELFEETGVKLEPGFFFLKELSSSTSGNLLIFCGLAGIKDSSIPEFISNDEVSELIVAYEPMELAFPNHTDMMKRFFRTHLR